MAIVVKASQPAVGPSPLVGLSPQAGRGKTAPCQRCEYKPLSVTLPLVSSQFGRKSRQLSLLAPGTERAGAVNESQMRKVGSKSITISSQSSGQVITSCSKIRRAAAAAASGNLINWQEIAGRGYSHGPSDWMSMFCPEVMTWKIIVMCI